jgi:hypothetical protein
MGNSSSLVFVNLVCQQSKPCLSAEQALSVSRVGGRFFTNRPSDIMCLRAQDANSHDGVHKNDAKETM